MTLVSNIARSMMQRTSLMPCNKNTNSPLIGKVGYSAESHKPGNIKTEFATSPSPAMPSRPCTSSVIPNQTNSKMPHIHGLNQHTAKKFNTHKQTTLQSYHWKTSNGSKKQPDASYSIPKLTQPWQPPSIQSQRTKPPPTDQTMRRTKYFVDYCWTHPNASIQYHVSDMHLWVDSDVAYLVGPKAHSRLAGHYFLSDKPQHEVKPHHNP